MPKQTDPQFKVRIPPELDSWLERQAQENHRTKTAEVTFRLQQARNCAEREAAGSASQA